MSVESPFAVGHPLSPGSLPSPPHATDLPLLLYLPGMDGTGELFYRQAAELGQDYTITTLNLNSVQPETWENLVEHVRMGIDPQRPVVLCGESFGACLALEVAARYPRLCTELILINPASSFRRGPWWLGGRLLLPFLPEFLYKFLAEQGLSSLAQLYLIDPVDREQLSRAVHSVPLLTTTQRLALLSSFDPQKLLLREVQIPTLLVAGAQDQLLPSLSEATRLARLLPKAVVEVAPYSGHACLLERDFSLRRLLLKQNFLPNPLAFSSVG